MTLIDDLRSAGMTQRQIAEATGCTQPCIAALETGRRGSRVGYDLGKALVDLHAAKVGRKPGATD